MIFLEGSIIWGPVTFKLRVENPYIVEIHLFMNRNLVFVVFMEKTYNIIAINSKYNIISSTFLPFVI